VVIAYFRIIWHACDGYPMLVKQKDIYLEKALDIHNPKRVQELVKRRSIQWNGFLGVEGMQRWLELIPTRSSEWFRKGLFR